MDRQQAPTGSVLWDKMAVLQVIGCLIKNPLIFADKNYSLNIDDFPERFHKIVFGAIEHLAKQGMQSISMIDIDQFLIKYDVQYNIFIRNDGMDYLRKCFAVARPDEFGAYYRNFKKYSLLNKLKESGFDTREIIDPDEINPKIASEKQAKFDNMEVEEILNIYESKIIEISQNFHHSEDILVEEAGDGLRELIESFKEAPEMGLPSISPKCTTLFRGQRLKRLYIESSGTGGGKSRRMIAEATHLAVPQFYDTFSRRWVNTGLQESVLYISTELTFKEVKSAFTAYVSGVDENIIMDGNYNDENWDQVDKAVKYIERSKLFLVQMSNFNVEDIENTIKLFKQKHNVRYVYFDYVSTSLKIMAEASGKTRISGLREDQILLMMVTRLKDLCNNLNIHIRTATQLSGDYKNAKEADQTLLRGAKAIADKADIGIILLPVRESDEDLITSYMQKGFTTAPNLVLHIYKMRQARIREVKLYIYLDYATCRSQDCFAVDREGNFIDVDDTYANIELYDEQDQAWADLSAEVMQIEDGETPEFVEPDPETESDVEIEKEGEEEQEPPILEPPTQIKTKDGSVFVL